MERMDKVFAPVEEVIEKSPDVTPEAKKQLTQVIKEAKKEGRTPLETDKWIYRFVVGFLGLAILASLIFTFFLSVGSPDPKELKIPDIFLAIGSAGVGALAGLLAPSPGRGSSE